MPWYDNATGSKVKLQGRCMAAQRKEEDEARKERVIFLLTRKELDAIDQFAKEKYFGNRSILIRDALIDFGVIKKPKQ
jgi:metal-responsive CopG/Arc/MetJ family transcriptional regulator